MKIIIFILPLSIASTVLSAPIAILAKRAVPESLIPEFGHKAGLNPTGTGDCDGAVNGPNGQPIKIPCICPPDRKSFIDSLNANVAAGHAVNNPSVKVEFPLGGSKEDKVKRMQASLVTLQNLRGEGVGCPASSTTFGKQLKAIQDGKESEPVQPPPPPPPAPSPPKDTDIETLAPDLGHQSGLNPTGTGDCDGAVLGPNGKPIKNPCSCPPPRDVFITALTANVAAGRAINNPSIAVKFPTGNSNADKAERIRASLVTLQNLKGPGVGCPASSTTLSAQLRAVSR